MFIYTDWVTTVDPELSYNAGWSQCAIVSAILLMSLFSLVWQTLQNLKQSCRKKPIKMFLKETKQKLKRICC